MFQRRPRRFRHRSNGRNNHHRGSRDVQGKLRSNLFLNSNNKNNHRGNQSAEKLLEKYNVLAKEALSSGDKILSENYLQHADHFMRIIEDKNKNYSQTKQQTDSKQTAVNEKLVENKTENQVNNGVEKKED